MHERLEKDRSPRKLRDGRDGIPSETKPPPHVQAEVLSRGARGILRRCAPQFDMPGRSRTSCPEGGTSFRAGGGSSLCALGASAVKLRGVP